MSLQALDMHVWEHGPAANKAYRDHDLIAKSHQYSQGICCRLPMTGMFGPGDPKLAVNERPWYKKGSDPRHCGLGSLSWTQGAGSLRHLPHNGLQNNVP